VKDARFEGVRGDQGCPPVCDPSMILIADDNENDSILIVETLKAAGVKNQIMLVVDGKDVIAYLKGEQQYADRATYPQPSILLLDLRMPKIGGFEVLEWLKFAIPTRDILIVIFSGYAELSDIRRGYELGARSFLPKPCRVEDIQNLVRAYSTYWQVDNTTWHPRARQQTGPA